MHLQFFFLILLFINYFYKIEFTVIKNIFYVNCKHVRLVYKIIMLFGKNNNKYTCEFLLICIVGFLYKVSLRLHNLEI
jgi:hypothetical protein